ncbi:hypothetical protein ABZ826_38585 [Streptomyces sp. NPDC047515]|uniref:hypothetical protein n=1 Tax=Streptomyces sp. NPDC047515 TaxID=3155380 RepID=UPI0033D3B5D2
MPLNADRSADALQELVRAVGRIVERGEAKLPAPAGAGQLANLSDGLATLRSVSETIHGLVARHASTTVHALNAAPSSAPVPADAHQTVGDVAALLAEQHDGAVTLNTYHEDGAYEDSDDGFGCGCDVTIVSGGEEYNFHRVRGRGPARGGPPTSGTRQGVAAPTKPLIQDGQDRDEARVLLEFASGATKQDDGARVLARMEIVQAATYEDYRQVAAG